MSQHTLSVLMQNHSGVLARVSSLFARRGFNIVSLTVAQAELDGYSRITLSVDADSTPLEQVSKQLDKLVEVVRISELLPEYSVEQELLLATVAPSSRTHQDLEALLAEFGASLLTDTRTALVISASGTPSRLDEFVSRLAHFNVQALQRTGRVALSINES